MPQSARELIRKLHIQRIATEYARRGEGMNADLFQYAMEWAFFTRTQHGAYDSALYELERCWGQPPGSPIPHAATKRPTPARVIHTLEDAQQALRHFVDQLIQSGVIAYATHVSTDFNYRAVTEAQMAAALARRAVAGQEEREIYTSYIQDSLPQHAGKRGAAHRGPFSYGAEPLPHETGSLLPQRSIADVAEIIARHPKVRFVCMEASRHGNQSLCTLGRELPNFSLIGYWWHNFFPGAMRQVMEERLDMLPMNKQIGFFTDAYTIEWTYAKARMIHRQLAQVLAQKIRQGQYDMDTALLTARHILFDSAQTLMGLRPVEVTNLNT